MVSASETVVLRLVGAATLVGHRAQNGEAKLHRCAGGHGPIILTPEAAADLLLSNRPVRIYAADEQAVRSAMAEQALAGRGPDGEGRNWGGNTVGPEYGDGSHNERQNGTANS